MSQVRGLHATSPSALAPSPWAPLPAQDPEVDHALVESSLVEGERGWWGLVVCLKKDQRGMGSPKLLYSLKPDRGTAAPLADAELGQLERTVAGTNTTARVMGRQPETATRQTRHLRAGTQVRSSGLEVRGQGAAVVRTPHHTAADAQGEMCTCCCSFPRRAGPEQHMPSSCHQLKLLEAGCTGKRTPSCWRQCL